MSVRDPAPRGLAAAATAWGVAVGVLVVAGPLPVVDNSVAALLRSDAPAVETYSRFLTQFGSDEIIVAQLSGGEPFDRFRLTAALTSTLAADPSMQGVLSVTALHADLTEVILDEVFGGPETLTERQNELQSPVVAALSLWSSQSRIYGLASMADAEARAALRQRIEALRRRAADEGLRLAVTGPPLLNLALDEAGRQTEATALPLLLVVAVAALLLSTRSLRATVALIAPVGLTVLAVDRGFAAVGGVTNLLVNIAKPLLFVIGLASAIHIFAEARHLAHGASRTPAWSAARHKAVAVTLALTTTAVGFGSLATSSIAPIRAFGQVAGAGLLLMVPTVLLLVPLLLSWPGTLTAGGGAAAGLRDRTTRWAVRIVEASLRRPQWGPLLGLAILAGGGVAFGALTVEPHAIRYFEPDHPLRRDQADLEAAGMGVATVEAVVSGPALAKSPTAAATLLAFAEHGTEHPAVAAAIGWPHLAEEVRVAARRSSIDRWVLEKLNARTESRTFAVDDSVRIAFLVKTVDAPTLDDLKHHLRTTAKDTLPFAFDLQITGNYDLLLQAQEDLLDTVITSLFWTALFMELVLIVVLRSLRLGLLALIPNLLPVAFNIIVMALAGIPLDLGTSMTAAIALGIAVDDTLHFIFAAYRPRAGVRRRTDRTPESLRDGATLDGPREDALVDGPREDALVDGPREDALVDGPREDALVDGPREDALVDGPREDALVDGPREDALVDGPREDALMVGHAARSAGAAIVLSSIVIGLGFAALLTAGFLPTRRFGILCALAMFSALFADLYVFPPLLRWATASRADH